MENLPVGYRFMPTDEELINYFLDKKLKGENLPHGVVKECDVYGDKEPWKLFDKDTNQKFYVFVKLKKKRNNARMIKRTAGCGTWYSQNTGSIYDGEGGLIGLKKLLVFQVPKASGAETGDKGHWIMHEYSTRSQQDKYVVCRIRNKNLDKVEPSMISKKMEAMKDQTWFPEVIKESTDVEKQQEELPLFQPHTYENQINPQMQSQSIQTQLPIERLIRAVKRMSPQALSVSVASIHSVVRNGRN